MALTKIDDRGLKTPIDLLDNEKIRFGTGNDLKIYHSGTASIISDTNANSDLYIMTDRGGFLNQAGNEWVVKYEENSFVELYYDNSKKLETYADGAKTHGDHFFVGTNGNAVWQKSLDKFFHGDNVKAAFGNGDDLQIYHDGSVNRIVGTGAHDIEVYTSNTKRFTIGSNGNTTYLDDVKSIYGTGSDLRIYHDGSNSYLKNTNGALLIRGAGGSDHLHLEPKDNENGIIVKPDSGVDLYYDNSKKLETTSYGTYVSGISKADNFGINDSGKYKAGAGDDLQIYHDGSNSYITDTGTGRLLIKASGVRLHSDTFENFLHADANSSVELFYDNSKKFETTSSGVNVTGALNVNGAAFSSGMPVHTANGANVGNGEAFLLTSNSAIPSSWSWNGSTFSAKHRWIGWGQPRGNNSQFKFMQIVHTPHASTYNTVYWMFRNGSSWSMNSNLNSYIPIFIIRIADS